MPLFKAKISAVVYLGAPTSEAARKMVDFIWKVGHETDKMDIEIEEVKG